VTFEHPLVIDPGPHELRARRRRRRRRAGVHRPAGSVADADADVHGRPRRAPRARRRQPAREKLGLAPPAPEPPALLAARPRRRARARLPAALVLGGGRRRRRRRGGGHLVLALSRTEYPRSTRRWTGLDGARTRVAALGRRDAARACTKKEACPRSDLAYREEEREMIPFCADQGWAFCPYSPLARGLLARLGERSGIRPTARAVAELADGSGKDDNDPTVLDVVDALRAVATHRDLPPAQIALAWLLGKPAVSAPIVGATKPGHLDDALAALDLILTTDEGGNAGDSISPRALYDYS